MVALLASLHEARYSSFSKAATTEAKIAEDFSKGACAGEAAGAGSQTLIFFRHITHCKESLRVDLCVTYHNHIKEGREYLQKMKRRNAVGSLENT